MHTMKKYHAKAPQNRHRPAKKAVMSVDTWFFIKRLAVGLLVITCLALLITGVWHATRISALTVSEITVEGGITVSHEEVRSLVEEELTGEYLHLIPKRFAWLYPEESIKEKVVNIERVSKVELQRISGSEIKVIFTEYEPFALWCSQQISNDCLFLDNNGLAFTIAPNLTGNSFIRYYSLGWDPQVKTQFILSEDFRALADLTGLLRREFGWPVLRVEVDTVRDAFLVLSGGGELKITLRDNPEQIVSNLQAVVSSKDYNKLQPRDFNYIDLRFGNKVFVHRGEVEDEEITDYDPNQDQLAGEDTEVARPAVAGANTDRDEGVSLMSAPVADTEEDLPEVDTEDDEE